MALLVELTFLLHHGDNCAACGIVFNFYRYESLSELCRKMPGNSKFRMMRVCFVRTARACRPSTVLSALLSLAVALLVACGGSATPLTTPPMNNVDLSVTGQTVIKARTAGSEVVVLEERLNSIFENGPQRTL